MPRGGAATPTLSLLLIAVVCCSAALQLPVVTIHWDATNKLFSESGSGFSELGVHIKDTVKIVCGKENAIIYMVDSLPAALHCSLGKSRKMVGICSKPGDTIQLVIRKFNPTPNAPEFKGKHNFLLSTSTGGDEDAAMNNEVGGLCATKHMRLRVLVVPRPSAASRATGGASTSSATATGSKWDGSPDWHRSDGPDGDRTASSSAAYRQPLAGEPDWMSGPSADGPDPDYLATTSAERRDYKVYYFDDLTDMNGYSEFGDTSRSNTPLLISSLWFILTATTISCIYFVFVLR